MSSRAGALAWSIAGLALALFGAGVVLSAIGDSPDGPQLGATDVMVFAAFLMYAAVGGLVAARRPSNPIGWLLTAEGVLLQLTCFSIGYAQVALFARPGTLPAGAAVAWLGNSLWIPILVVPALILLLFPTGHLISARWRVVVVGGLVVAAAGFTAEAFKPGSLGGSLAAVDNPVGIPGVERLLTGLATVAAILGPLLFVAALVSFGLRFRAATGTQRQQLRWLAYAAAMLAVGFVVGDVLQAIGTPSALYAFCYLLPLAALPVAIGIAVLRYRLYEIEVVIDRTVVVGGVAGFAAVVYTAVLVGVGAAVGNSAGSNVVLAAVATAVVALAFHPVLLWAQRLGRRIAYGAPGAHEHETGLALRCLGAFRVFRDGVPVPATAWQSKKARTLLKILVARRGRSTPRSMAMEALWPDEDTDRLANRLAVALATARGVLDPDKAHDVNHFLVADRDAIRLDLDHVAVDVEDFIAGGEQGLAVAAQGEAESAARLLTDAMALYAGDFLEEDLYDDWAEELRETARASYVSIARTLAGLLHERGDNDAAVRCYLRILGQDPWDEDAHLRIVVSLEESGRRGEARRRYQAYADKMSELDLPAAPFPAVRGG